jgi:Holliday junction resolvasome RuvABC ATP-dependent DNA helicase subunit
MDPIRATALLTSLNSNSLDIDEALYLQEEITNEEYPAMEAAQVDDYLHSNKEAAVAEVDDLDTFDWEKATQNQSITVEEEHSNIENDLDSLLGDFLNKMNK